jgi:hypothetical protein
MFAMLLNLLLTEILERVQNGLQGVGTMKVEGNQGRLLSTMAVVVATADEGKDYLQSFTPFVADLLKGWPEGCAVEPHELSIALCDGWGFPSVPSAVSKVLLQRAQKDGFVRNVERKYFPNCERLLEMPDLGEKRQEMLAEQTALAEAVVAYARDVHGLDWTEQEASAALERLTEDFGAELATAKREGGLQMRPKSEENESLAVVHAFARRAIERDPPNFNRLVAMVQGAMLANALYFEDLRKMPRRLPELRVYLDTTPLMRGLGFACPDVVTAAEEMLALMRSFKIPMFVFAHTLEEIRGILENIATSLRRGTQEVKDQGNVGGAARESVDAAIEAGMTSGDVLLLIANLEHRLEELGIRHCETPRQTDTDRIDEQQLAAVLDKRVRYGASKFVLERDLASLSAIDRLRGRTRPRDLADTRALFVTANLGVVRASREYFEDAGRDAPIPHCMSDVALTAQLWVSSSGRKPELPRRLLIADSYSALAPSPKLWERWVRHIIKLRQRERITEEQLLTLIYNQQIRALLFEVARDDPDNVDDTAVADVLARYEAKLRQPAERSAEEAQMVAAEERRRLLRMAEDLQQSKRQLEESKRQFEEWTQEQKHRRARRASKRMRCRRIARRVTGLLATVPFVSAFTVLAATKQIEGKFWWATSVTLLVFACSGTVSWGLRRGWKAPFAVLIAAGALSVLWANIFGIAGS